MTAGIEDNAVLSLSLLIGILITVVVGAILFYVIDRFCPEARLAMLLKLLVVLVCLGSIISRLYPLFSGDGVTP
jgi:FtsH-binding integral membrane protein